MQRGPVLLHRLRQARRLRGGLRLVRPVRAILPGRRGARRPRESVPWIDAVSAASHVRPDQGPSHRRSLRPEGRRGGQGQPRRLFLRGQLRPPASPRRPGRPAGDQRHPASRRPAVRLRVDGRTRQRLGRRPPQDGRPPLQPQPGDLSPPLRPPRHHAHLRRPPRHAGRRPRGRPGALLRRALRHRRHVAGPDRPGPHAPRPGPPGDRAPELPLSHPRHAGR